MKKAKIRLFLAVLSLVAACILLPEKANAAEIVGRGGCLSSDYSSNVSWSLDSYGILTFSGNGSGYGYDTYDGKDPFDPATVKKLVIGSGITDVDALIAPLNKLQTIVVESGNSKLFVGSDGILYRDIEDPEAEITYVGGLELVKAPCTLSGAYTLTADIVEVSGGAFHGCTGITSIAVADDSYLWVEDNMLFGYNDYFSSYHFQYLIFAPCSLTGPIDLSDYMLASRLHITEFAFSDCTKLTEISFPDSAFSIGRYAFANCTGLTSISLSDNMVDFSLGAFSGCTGLTSVSIAEGGYVPDYAFQGCTKLSKVTLPDGMYSIGTYAFSGCTSLTKFIIPEGIKVLQGYVFDGCTSLSDITLAESIEVICPFAFQGCTALTDIRIPKGVNRIADGYSFSYVFNGCTNLSGVTVDSNNTIYSSDGKGAIFSKDKSELLFLAPGISGNYSIPSSVTTIEYNAFGNCTKLTSVSIPDSVTTIGWAAFENCTKLTSVSIPDSVTAIGQQAFSSCSDLVSITLPGSITELETSMFFGCTKLKDIALPEGLVKIGHDVFRDCASLVTLKIPESVTSIGKSAFYGCTSLVSIALPDGITEIRNGSFILCSSLKTLIIPKSVTSVEAFSFYENALTDVIYLGTEADKAKITIGKNNEPLLNAKWHYNATLNTHGDTVFYSCPTCYGAYSLSGAAVGHAISQNWSTDGTNHWHACTCGEKEDLAAHTPGAAATETTPQICTVCQYIIAPALNHVHNYSDTWQFDITGHWHACDGCSVRMDEAAHAPSEACYVCGYTPATQETQPSPSTPSSAPEKPADVKDSGKQKLAPSTVILIAAASVAAVGGAGAGATILIKRKKK